MAKLLHSSMYGYDYLVNDLFKLSENKNHFSLIFNWRDNKNILDELSKNLIINEGFSFQDVKFVVGLLFLSMTPLHNESKIKQKAMYLHGLSIVNEIYHEQ
jgi:hypothetical protein